MACRPLLLLLMANSLIRTMTIPQYQQHSLANAIPLVEVPCDPSLAGYNVGLPPCENGYFCHPSGICQSFTRNQGREEEGRFSHTQSETSHKTLAAYRPRLPRLSEHFDELETVQNSGRPAQLAPKSPGTDAEIAEAPLVRQPLAPIFGSVPGPSPAPSHPNPGYFTVSGSSGVPAMHAALMQNGRVIFLDKVENYTELTLQNGQLAYSSEYDPSSGQLVPLSYKTNAFCSGGVFLADGRLISVGGNGPLPWTDPTVADGFDGIRYIERSISDKGLNGVSWYEPGNKLASKRWYSSAQTMPDGTIFVASGSLNGLDLTQYENNNPTFEILDQNGISSGKNVRMNILVQNQPYYLYPFIHVLRDGSLFVFTSRSSQLFDVKSDRVIKELPDLPGMFRTYPNTGGSVMLPLRGTNSYESEIVICGGGEFQDLPSPTDASCGRIRPESLNPTWELEAMPEGRGMVEGVLLPDGTVLWLNGAQKGAEGFGIADDPALEALIYNPEKPSGSRWTVAGRSEIPRLYHSVALLLLDGTVLVAGGNPNEQPILPQDVDVNITTRKYPTEFRIEIYTPPYLTGDKAKRRPENIWISRTNLNRNWDNQSEASFGLSFTSPDGARDLKVILYHGGFVTHALHMGQRMVVLDHENWMPALKVQAIQVNLPSKKWIKNILPPGPYVLYVVVDGVPGLGKFVQVD